MCILFWRIASQQPLPIHIAFSYCTPKLYTNSVLSSLNSRPNRRFETNEQWELPSSGQQEISLSELRARGISGNDGFASQNATGTKPGGTEVYSHVISNLNAFWYPHSGLHWCINTYRTRYLIEGKIYARRWWQSPRYPCSIIELKCTFVYHFYPFLYYYIIITYRASCKIKYNCYNIIA